MKVISEYGHCGANNNEYVEFTGTQEACDKFIADLPSAHREDLCNNCGGYSRTGLVKEVVRVIEDE